MPVLVACPALWCKLHTPFGRKAPLVTVKHSSVLVVQDNIKQTVWTKCQFETLKFLPNPLQLGSSVSTMVTMSNRKSVWLRRGSHFEFNFDQSGFFITNKTGVQMCICSRSCSCLHMPQKGDGYLCWIKLLFLSYALFSSNLIEKTKQLSSYIWWSFVSMVSCLPLCFKFP